jgi:hyaluronate lyase
VSPVTLLLQLRSKAREDLVARPARPNPGLPAADLIAPATALVLVLTTMPSAWGAHVQARAKADLALVKKRYLQLIAPPRLDARRPEVKRLLEDLDRAAAAAMKSQIMDSKSPSCGSWKGIAGRGIAVDGDSFNHRHMGPTRRLAVAYGTPGCKLHGDRKLLKSIVAALEFCEPRVRGGGKRRGNWWAWHVGIPGNLADTLLLTEGRLPAGLYARTKAALLALVKKKYRRNFYGGGANVLYVARNQLITAMLTGRTEYATYAAASYSAMSSISAGMGIQRDYSYHFHGHGLNMGYGRVQLGYVSEFTYLTGGTCFALTRKAMKTHDAWFGNFVVWNSYRGRVSPFTVGRSISRNGSVERPVSLEAAAFLYLCQESGCRELARSFIAEALRADPGNRFASRRLAALAPRLEKAPEGAKPMPRGARFYPLSDYLACRMGGFYAAVRMSSRRTKASFSIRSENLRGGRTGDGTLVLMTDGSEWDNEVIPTMNWYGLSGITVGPAFEIPPEKPAHSSIVGGLHHGDRCGAAGFDFTVKRSGAQLRAMKSYTVFDGAVVLLGTGVRLKGTKLAKGRTVSSVVHQCPLRDSDHRLLVNGRALALADEQKQLRGVRWLHVRNYGYCFPRPHAVQLGVTTTTRSYRYVNRRYGDERKYERRLYTLSVDHGAAPENGQYATIIFPGVTAGKIRSLAADPGVEIATARASHLVRDKKGGTTVCFFFAKDRIDGYRAERPLAAALSAEKGKVLLTLQDPTHRGGKVAIRIPMKVSGPGTKPDGRGTVVTAALDRGFQHSVELTAAAPR